MARSAGAPTTLKFRIIRKGGGPQVVYATSLAVESGCLVFTGPSDPGGGPITKLAFAAGEWESVEQSS